MEPLGRTGRCAQGSPRDSARPAVAGGSGVGPRLASRDVPMGSASHPPGGGGGDAGLQRLPSDVVTLRFQAELSRAI